MKRLASFAALGLGSLLLLILAVNAAVYGEARPYLYNDAA
ncbi:MAG: hypothetical protein UY97_C0006G0001, partial [Parcubacteria group bacterium GW2011_GWB1_57_6]